MTAEYDDVSLDELPSAFRDLFEKQRRRIDELEGFIENEHAPILDQLRELRDELELSRTENETLQLEVQSVAAEFGDRMEELSGVNEMLEMANEELQSQVDTLSGALEAQQKAMAAAVSAASGGSGVVKSPRAAGSVGSGKSGGKKKGKKKKGAGGGSRSPDSADVDGSGAPHLGIALSDEVAELRLRLEELGAQVKTDQDLIESLNSELAESRKDNEDLAEVCEELRLELEEKEWEANDAVEAAKLIKEDLDDTRQYLHKRMQSLSRLQDEVAEIKEHDQQNKASTIMSRSRADTRKVLLPLKQKSVSSTVTTPTKSDERKSGDFGDVVPTITISTERPTSTGVGGRYRTVSAVDLIIGDMSAADLAAELAVPPSPSPGASPLISGSATPVSPQPLAGGSASEGIQKASTGGSSESERRDSVDSFDGAEAGRRGSVVYAGAGEDDWFADGGESPTMDYETSVFNLSDTELPEAGGGRRRPSIVPPTSTTEDVGLVRSRLDSDLAMDEDFVSKDMMNAEIDSLKDTYEKKITKLKNKHLEKVKKLKKEHKQTLKKKTREAQKKMKVAVDKEQKRIRSEIKQWMDNEYKSELAEMQRTQKTLKTERLLTKYTGGTSTDLTNTLSAGGLSVISDGSSAGGSATASPAGKGGKVSSKKAGESAASKRAARDMKMAKIRLRRRKEKMERAKKDAAILGRFNGFSKYKIPALGTGIAAPWLFKVDVL